MPTKLAFRGDLLQRTDKANFPTTCFKKGHDIFFSEGSLVWLFLLQQGVF